jgi:hypothetical protein
MNNPITSRLNIRTAISSGFIQRINRHLDRAIGHLALVPGSQREIPGSRDEHPGERKEEDQISQQINRPLRARIQFLGHDINPHMRLVAQRIAAQHDEIETEHLFGYVKGPSCRLIERIAQNDIIDDDGRKHDCKDRYDPPHDLVKAVYRTHDHDVPPATPNSPVKPGARLRSAASPWDDVGVFHVEIQAPHTVTTKKTFLRFILKKYLSVDSGIKWLVGGKVAHATDRDPV